MNRNGYAEALLTLIERGHGGGYARACLCISGCLIFAVKIIWVFGEGLEDGAAARETLKEA